MMKFRVTTFPGEHMCNPSDRAFSVYGKALRMLSPDPSTRFCHHALVGQGWAC